MHTSHAQVVEAGLEEECKKFARYSYPLMTKQQGNFHLTVSDTPNIKYHYKFLAK